ncbi:MAG: DNA primase small subunit domain-containing protein [Candidatus Methanosuratincola sp.]|nr:hypothetical protein [Candidatus Methanosuratincola sp.]
MAGNLRDHILLLLAIKAPEARIDVEHICEKVSRDASRSGGWALTKEGLIAELKKLEAEGLVESRGGFHYITDAGRSELRSRLPEASEYLNLSYRMVLAAKEYYPRAADQILPFLRGRPVSVIKVFSDESDPIGKVKPLFVRYARYKPKPEFIRIETKEELLRYVDDHAVDFVPYVHDFSAKEPSWLVVDLDAGEGLKGAPEGFLAVKFVAEKVFRLLEGCGISPAVKFSGSRGMQVWAALDNGRMPKGDLFAYYRRLVQLVQARVEDEIAKEGVPEALRGLADQAAGGGGLTTAKVAGKGERARKVLLDWSSMKPMGDVRAPFSIHYKTGLVSCPVDPSRILEFDPAEAAPGRVAEEAWRLSRFFSLEKGNPERLLERTGFLS